MRYLSFIILIILFLSGNILFAQSSHGDDLKFDCSACHNSVTWEIKSGRNKFDHDQTGFSLIEQHKLVNCKSCHTNLIFSQADPECNSCHTDIHQESVGLDCVSCHTSNSWIVEDIKRIHQERRFPLTGNHLLADCAQCHSRYIDLYFEPISIDCFSCHENDYNSASFPNHIAAGFSTDCEMCHSINSDGWAATSIIHDFFPLVGGHAIQNCFACHEQGADFTGLSRDCYTCHKQDFEATQDPSHVQNGFPTDCKQCHTIIGWSPATFDHSQTSFPLTGKHTSVSCSDCHTSGYSNTPSECYFCHQLDYESTTDPNHVANDFPTDCSQCHNTNGWEDAEFDHSQTGFSLTGKHMTISCIDCHSNGYTNTPSECYSCHQQDYESTTDPNHVTNSFPTDCSQCHSTDNWDNAEFDHSQTDFPLTGQHTTAACIDCHSNGYTNTPVDCYSCHSSNYNSTTDPDHQALGYPTTCEDCHSTSEWSGATFDHSQTGFPLTGQHATTACINCHSTGYINIPTDCYSCHQQDYESTTDPNHVTNSFPTDCSQCHSTDNWDNAEFDHNQTDFPLTGQHITTACIDCHSNGYMNTPIECYSCHATNYNSTTDPDHQVLGFPTTCDECHSTSDWSGATFDHSFYNLSGNHSTMACTECHSEANFQPQCLSCHQNDFQEGHNQGDPTDCWNCHSTSRWGDGDILKIKNMRN
jgi:hypothetical protein